MALRTNSIVLASLTSTVNLVICMSPAAFDLNVEMEGSVGDDQLDERLEVVDIGTTVAKADVETRPLVV